MVGRPITISSGKVLTTFALRVANSKATLLTLSSNTKVKEAI